MENKDIKNILTGIGLVFLIIGQIFILSGTKMVLGIIFTVICALIFLLAFTGKYSVIVDAGRKVAALIAVLLAPKPKKDKVPGKTLKLKPSKKGISQEKQAVLPVAPKAPLFNLLEAIKKFGTDGVSFFVPKWFLFVISGLLFGAVQYFFFTSKLSMAVMALGVIAVILTAAFRMKETGFTVHINLGSSLKVLSMVAGLVLLAFGWIMLINQRIPVQEMGVALTIPGCILAYLGLPKRSVTALDAPETRSDILFLRSGIVDNYIFKAILIILSVVALKAGYKIMQHPDYNMYSMIFYGLAIAMFFFAMPLFNFAEKPIENKFVDIAKLVLVVGALFLAYFGQRDFLANKPDNAITKYIISALIFIFAFPVYTSKQPEEKEPFPIKVEVIFLIVIVAVGLFLRLNEIDARPFGIENDEAGGYTARINNNGDPTLPLSVGNFGLHVHIVQFFIKIFGELNRMSIKMLAVSVGLLSIPMLYFLVRALLNPRAAMFATVLFTFLRWNLHYSRSGHSVVLMNAAIICAFYFFFKAIETRKPFIWFLAGLSLGLTWHGVMTGFLLIIPVALYFIISAFSRKDFFKANTIGMFAFALGLWIFGSMTVHNFFISKSIYFARAGEVSVFSKDPNAPSKNPAKGIVENTRLVLSMFNRQGDSRQRNSGGQPYEPTIDFTSSVLYGIGFFYALYYSKYYMFFILVMVFFSQAAGSIFSIEAPSAMRAVGTMIPVVFFIAFVFDKIWLAVRRVFGKKWEVVYLPLLLAVFLVPIIKDNYKQYFGRWVGGMDELTTATGLYSRHLGDDWRIIMYTNTYFPAHPPFKINRSQKANTASRLTTGLSYLRHVDKDNFAILFHYDTWQNFEDIRQFYFPEAGVEDVSHNWFNKKLKPGEGWGTFAKALLITNDYLKKLRGLTGSYSFGGGAVPNDLPVFRPEDAGRAPYTAVWKGTLMIPYYGKFKFVNSGTAAFKLVIDGKNIPAGAEVLLAEGFHTVEISATRKNGADTLSLNVMCRGLTGYSFRGTETIKLDDKFLYNFKVAGLHGYYINGNGFDLDNKDSEIIDTNMQFDGGIFTTAVYWKGTIDIREPGDYIINASSNGFVRIVLDNSSYWEMNNGRNITEAEKYFRDKPMKQVQTFSLSKGRHKIAIYNLSANIMHLNFNKVGQASKPMPVEILEPDFEISKE